jgi:signal transduction histidine kinase
MNDDIMFVPDATQDVRFGEDPAVIGRAAIRFYAGAPLTLPSGFRLGTLCMMDKNPRPEGLSERECEILRSLVALVVREIEYRQEITNETIDLSDELLNAQSAKQQFLQMLSHELRAPLNAVMGFSTMIATAADDAVVPKYKTYADDIGQAGDHLLTLIDGILDWTRLERGELGIEDSVVTVPDLIEKAVALLPSADSRIDVLPMEKLPELRCDPRYVVQELAHVLDNAVTFSPEGEQVTGSADVNDQQNLIVRATDRGPGINNEIRTRAFGVFEKFVPSGTKFAEGIGIGIGLGLLISRKLMEVHGGSIDFADDQDSGATVVLAFPAHRTVI